MLIGVYQLPRRAMMTTAAASLLGVVAACSSDPRAKSANQSAGPSTGERFTPPTGITKVPVPHGTIYALPSPAGNRIALTVDDGTDPAVVAGYVKLAHDTGLRLTFFVNGINRSWDESRAQLRPLVDDGQAFLSNHTWSHPNLLTLSSADLADQVHRNEQYLHNTFGVFGRPFLRPPYGYRNAKVDAQLADLGYPAVTMWYGSLGDSTNISSAKVLKNAREWFQPGHLVIGHANHPGVTHVYEQLVEIIRDRHLQPVHLGDVYDI